VLRPPGGGSSIMFGGEEPAYQKNEAPARHPERKAELRDPVSETGKSAPSSHQHGPVASGIQQDSNGMTVTTTQSAVTSSAVGYTHARAKKTCKNVLENSVSTQHMKLGCSLYQWRDVGNACILVDIFMALMH